MTSAQMKMKAKLFSRFSAEQLHLDPASFQPLPSIDQRPMREPTAGGIAYRILDRNRALTLQLQHDQRDEFSIFIIEGDMTRIAFGCKFSALDREAKRAIDMVMTEPLVPPAF